MYPAPFGHFAHLQARNPEFVQYTKEDSTWKGRTQMFTHPNSLTPPDCDQITSHTHTHSLTSTFTSFPTSNCPTKSLCALSNAPPPHLLLTDISRPSDLQAPHHASSPFPTHTTQQTHAVVHPHERPPVRFADIPYVTIHQPSNSIQTPLHPFSAFFFSHPYRQLAKAAVP